MMSNLYQNLAVIHFFTEVIFIILKYGAPA